MQLLIVRLVRKVGEIVADGVTRITKLIGDFIAGQNTVF
jgi:hypothetical protein